MKDWHKRIEESLDEYKDKIEINTFAYMVRNYTKLTPNEYSYIAIDDERVIIRTKLEKPSKIKGLALI